MRVISSVKSVEGHPNEKDEESSLEAGGMADRPGFYKTIYGEKLDVTAIY